MKDIPQFISYFTKKLVDEGQSISDDSIIVEVFGPNFFDLTLIDLPGIVRTVGDGEDPLIIPKVKELVARYMKQKHTIILAVLPANVDIHNSEVLQNASEVDPKGERTLGIITKSDLIDQGAESSVIDILNNTKKYLHHGYHAVICRGQTDLNKGATIECGLNKEMLYFQNQVAWQKVAKSNLGIQTLGKKLVNLLDEQIEAALPSVLKEVDMKLGECRSRLDVLGYALDTPSARHSSYINIMHQYDAFIRQANLGDYSHEFFLEEGIDNKLRARIIKEELKFQKILQNIRFDSKMYIKIAIGDYVDVNFKDDWIDACVVSLPQTNGSIQITLDSSVDPKKIVQRLSAPKWRIKDKIAVDGLKELIQDRRGDQLPIFPSHAIFSNLVGEHINKWIHPSISLLEEVVFIFTEITERMILSLNVRKRIQTLLPVKSLMK